MGLVALMAMFTYLQFNEIKNVDFANSFKCNAFPFMWSNQALHERFYCEIYVLLCHIVDFNFINDPIHVLINTQCMVVIIQTYKVSLSLLLPNSRKR